MGPWILVPLGLLVVWLWLTSRSIARIRGQLDEAEARLARRFYKLQERVTGIDATVRQLEFDRKRKRGEVRFGPDTRLGEAVAVHSKVQEILAAFGLTTGGAGCGGGGPDENATLAEACRAASLDVRDVLGALGRFVENPDDPIEARAATAKLYRIEGME